MKKAFPSKPTIYCWSQIPNADFFVKVIFHSITFKNLQWASLNLGTHETADDSIYKKTVRTAKVFKLFFFPDKNLLIGPLRQVCNFLVL